MPIFLFLRMLLMSAQQTSNESISFETLLTRMLETGSDSEIKLRARLQADGHEYFVTDQVKGGVRFRFRGYDWPRALPLRRERKDGDNVGRVMTLLTKGLADRRLELWDVWVECTFAGSVEVPKSYRLYKRKGETIALGVGDQGAYAAEFRVSKLEACVVSESVRGPEIFRVNP